MVSVASHAVEPTWPGETEAPLTAKAQYKEEGLHSAATMQHSAKGHIELEMLTSSHADFVSAFNNVPSLCNSE